MNRIHEAIIYATERHAGQLRKGTDLPYIVHPMEVMTILSRMNAHEDLLIAGILHDTAEDTDAAIEDIRALFGDTVAELVNAHTEKHKELPWEARKQAAIEHLRTAPREVKLLILADKLSNMRSMAHDHSQIGDRLWERFCRDKVKQSWYYSAAIDALSDMADDPDGSWAYWELNALYKDVFVEFFIDERRIMLFQRACHGEGYYIPKNDGAWYELPGQFSLTPITRSEAEFIEDVWKYV